MALAQDLRERIVRAVAEGQPIQTPARRFGVCVNTVTHFLPLQQKTGALDHRPMPGGQRRIPPDQEPMLPARREAAPDATMPEQCQWWAEQTGQTVSSVTMGRAVHRLGWTAVGSQRAERGGAYRLASGHRPTGPSLSRKRAPTRP